MKVEFIEVPQGGGPVGTVVAELERVLAIDAKAILPNRGDEIMLPHPHRKVRIVQQIRYRYGKRGLLKIEVILRQRNANEKTPSRPVNGRRRPSEKKVRQAADKLNGKGKRK